jgi:hypothetical protein
MNTIKWNTGALLVVNKAAGLEVNARILAVWTCFANRRQDTIPVWTQC